MVAKSRTRSRSQDEVALRAHIQTPPVSPESLTLESARLGQALESRPLVGRRFDISVDYGAEKLPESLDAEVMITSAKVDLGKTRELSPGLKWGQTTFVGVEGMLEDVPPSLKITNASGVLTKGKPGKADDVARLVRFLLSEDSGHITGTPIWIDGAQLLLI